MRFIWTGRPTFTRSKDGAPGYELKTGESYECDLFPAHVIDEWVATGNAEREGGKVKPKDTVLDVKSVTVKIKAPTVGVN